jgi:hypothetical protein
MARRILALVSEPVSGDALEQALGRDDAQDAELLVIAPALNTRTRFLLWQEEGLVDEAQERFDRPVRHVLVEP